MGSSYLLPAGTAVDRRHSRPPLKSPGWFRSPHVPFWNHTVYIPATPPSLMNFESWCCTTRILRMLLLSPSIPLPHTAIYNGSCFHRSTSGGPPERISVTIGHWGRWTLAGRYFITNPRRAILVVNLSPGDFCSFHSCGSSFGRSRKSMWEPLCVFADLALKR